MRGVRGGRGAEVAVAQDAQVGGQLGIAPSARSRRRAAPARRPGPAASRSRRRRRTSARRAPPPAGPGAPGGDRRRRGVHLDPGAVAPDGGCRAALHVGGDASLRLGAGAEAGAVGRAGADPVGAEGAPVGAVDVPGHQVPAPAVVHQPVGLRGPPGGRAVERQVVEAQALAVARTAPATALSTSASTVGAGAGDGDRRPLQGADPVAQARRAAPVPAWPGRAARRLLDPGHAARRPRCAGRRRRRPPRRRRAAAAAAPPRPRGGSRPRRPASPRPGSPGSRSRSTSLRTVRVVTSSRAASCGPVQSRRACSSASRRSSRADVSSIVRLSRPMRNDLFRIGCSILSGP